MRCHHITCYRCDSVAETAGASLFTVAGVMLVAHVVAAGAHLDFSLHAKCVRLIVLFFGHNRVVHVAWCSATAAFSRAGCVS